MADGSVKFHVSINTPSNKKWQVNVSSLRFSGNVVQHPLAGTLNALPKELSTPTAHAPDPFACQGACTQAAPLLRYQNSGNLGMGERWFVVSQPVAGWQASEMSGRTIRVNGVTVAPGAPLPPAINGKYYFSFSAGGFTWASWSFW